jgi:hypothetical protein
MDIYGYPWLSVDIHGYQYIHGNHGYPWMSVDILGYPWISIDIYGYLGYLWKTMKFMEIDEFPWISMDIHGMYMDIHGYPCISMGTHEYAWYPLIGGWRGESNREIVSFRSSRVHSFNLVRSMPGIGTGTFPFPPLARRSFPLSIR